MDLIDIFRSKNLQLPSQRTKKNLKTKNQLLNLAWKGFINY